MLITDEKRNVFEEFKHFLISEEPETLVEAEEYFNWICANNSKPYLINLGDCVEKGLIGEGNDRYNDGRYEQLRPRFGDIPPQNFSHRWRRIHWLAHGPATTCSGTSSNRCR